MDENYFSVLPTMLYGVVLLLALIWLLPERRSERVLGGGD